MEPIREPGVFSLEDAIHSGVMYSFRPYEVITREPLVVRHHTDVEFIAIPVGTRGVIVNQKYSQPFGIPVRFLNMYDNAVLNISRCKLNVISDEFRKVDFSEIPTLSVSNRDQFNSLATTDEERKELLSVMAKLAVHQNLKPVLLAKKKSQ